MEWKVRNNVIQMYEKITPLVLDKKGNPKPPSSEVRRMARDVERSVR